MINLLRQYGWSLFFCIVCMSLGFSFGQFVTTAKLAPLITAAERALSDAQFAFVQAQKMPQTLIIWHSVKLQPNSRH